MVPEFKNDPKWYKTQCDLLHNDSVKISQELEMKFLASSNSFFDPEIVEKLNDVPIPSISRIHLQKNDLEIWKTPDPNRFHMISVDTASASGSDMSTIEVLDYIDMEQVAEWVGKCRVDDFCQVVEMVNKIFPRNIIVVENNSYGNQVVEFLTTRTRSDHNIYKQKPKNNNIKHNAYSRYKYGLSTNASTRPLMIDALYTYIKENASLVKSKKLALELIGLEDNGNGKIEAGKGMHDDMAMAMAFACYVRMYDPPMSVASVTSNDVLMDVLETVDSNFSASQSNELASLRLSDKRSTGETNRIIGNHINNNLDKMLKEHGSTIDVGKLLGFDVRDDPTDRPTFMPPGNIRK